MALHIVVVENKKDWLDDLAGVQVITAREYLMKPDQYKSRHIRLINLCRSYRYLSTGYYCSLLGEARRHKVIPSVRTVTDLSSKAIYSLNFDDMDDLVHRALQRHKHEINGDRFELYIFFGQSEIKELYELSRMIFDAVRSPLLKVEFRRQTRWQIYSIRPVFLNNLTSVHREFFAQTLNGYLSARWRTPKAKSQLRYDLAVLYNPDEKLPPSNMGALRKFIDIGKRMDVNVELIQKKDYGRLAEYDALFIRETTGIDHYTYRFSKKAEAEGMVVLDDPDSILKCTNKVYLSELLAASKISAPRTLILHKGEPLEACSDFGFPIVLKIPDGSFSRGMYKAENLDQVRLFTAKLFRESDLILAQEFLYTEFDWRIGILNNAPIFACQYFMSPEHWQIVKHGESGNATEGGFKTFELTDVPDAVISVATSAARLIGDGFYGVDVKHSSRGTYVIEVNDNPNLDSGVEDAIMGADLYRLILMEFIRRIEKPREISQEK